MDTERIQTIKEDVNQINNKQQSNFQTLKSSHQSDIFNTKTESLSFLQETTEQLNLPDIIPFYNELDQKIFSYEFNIQFIYSEKKEFSTIEEIKNQRILILRNNSTSITCVMNTYSQQLMVIKSIETINLEQAIQGLDEYKIHYKLNQMYPKSTLKLFLPVSIYKENQFYKIKSCLERAQFNLYEYSRKHQINKEYAPQILFQIISQIIDMHSINIAHRDIKPQNIFYVVDKGWVLSDFGESLEYKDVEQFYNIRGTTYFMKTSLRQEINSKKTVQQNLLANDIYALVVFMIMIQSQQYIQNIEEVINSQDDQIIQDLIKINSLIDLINVYKQNKIAIFSIILDESPIYIELNTQNIKENNNFLFLSWLGWLKHLEILGLNEILENQLREFIQSNIQAKQLIQLNDQIFMSLCNFIIEGVNLKLEHPYRFIKDFDRFNIDQKKRIVLLFHLFGFNEKTIKYANKIQSQNYCQNIHYIIISCQDRNLMLDNCEKELTFFNQNLQVDQLNTGSQFDYLIRLNNQPSQDYLCKMQDNKQIINKFMIPCISKLYQTSRYQPEQHIVSQYLQYIFTYCSGDYMKSKADLFEKKLSIDAYELFLQNILQMHIVSCDRNTIIAILFDLGIIFQLLNRSKQKQLNLTQMQQMIFYPDSFQQFICFQISIYLLKISYQKGFKKQNFNIYLQRIRQLILNLKHIRINIYKAYIILSLLRLNHRFNLLQNKFQNHDIIYIIQFSIQYAYLNNYHIKYKDFFFIKLCDFIYVMIFVINIQQIINEFRKPSHESKDIQIQLLSQTIYRAS